MGVAIFQIKKGELASYRLPQNNVAIDRPGKGLRYIAYYKGRDSIFMEDYDKEDLKPSKVPEFTFNPTRRKCELRFSDADKNLYTYITSHPEYDKVFERYSEEIENEKKLGKAELIERALEYVNESNEVKLRALGLVLIGFNETYNKPISTIKALLKDDAINKPKEIIAAKEDDLFDKKYLVSLALCSGVIKTNNTKTAIVWSDNNGRILNIATGEDYIGKFAQHLHSDTQESRTLNQEIGNRLNIIQESEKAKSKEASELEALKAKLAAIETDYEIVKGKNQKLEEANDKLIKAQNPTVEELALKEAREQYELAYPDKKVPMRYFNDLDWLNEKILESQSNSTE